MPFISGFIGTCSFDLVRHKFPKLRDIHLSNHREHDVQFYLVENVYVFDHYKEELYIIASNLFSNRTKENLKEDINKRLEELKTIDFWRDDIKFDSSQRRILTNISENQFIQNIRALKKKIKEGDMFQVVPSRIYSYIHHFDCYLHQLTFQLYQKLKRRNPSPYMYYINKDIPIIIGSSPESFVKVKDNFVYTNPIAGTVERGNNVAQDEKNATLLINDENEVSEHSMLVDLGRNDIHRICKTGTSKITKLMNIEKYEHVMHIVSEVVGELKPNISLMSVIASLLPTGTVSGASIILLIVNILTDEQLKDLYAYATQLDLEVLVEVHDRYELERAHQLSPHIIGVNSRDLKRFVTDVERTNNVLKNKKAKHYYISESGIHSQNDVQKIITSGIDGLLIGEALMKSENLSQFLPSLKLPKVKR